MTSLYDRDLLTRLTVKRLADLSNTRAQVERLERRADALAEAALERRKAELLAELSVRVAALGPVLRDMSYHVAELKAYLQSVYDADLIGDSVLQTLASEHCVGYTVRLLERISDPSTYAAKGAVEVLELGTSTLAMFAARPSAGQVLLDAGAIPLAIKLLSPLFPTVVVVNTCNALSSLANFTPARLALRASGGVGALVRLLRPDVEAAAQTAAAAALSLLSASDAVIQDSVRYLGGIDHLVALIATGDAYTAEVCRYALHALRSGNVKNTAEIITALRASPALAKNVRRLESVSDLLRFETPTVSYAPPPRIAPYLSPSGTPTSLLDVRGLLDELTVVNTALSSPRPRSPAVAAAAAAAASAASAAALRASLNASPILHPPVKSSAQLIKEAAIAALSPPGSPRVRASPSPLSAYTIAPVVSPSTVDTYTSIATAAIDTYKNICAAQATSPVPSAWSISAGLVEVESELLRKKHLARFTPQEVALLLSEMGFDALDLRGFKTHAVDGQALLELSESALMCEFVLPRARARKIRTLQAATLLFDRIATLPRQGKLSEVEIRLFLAGQGASTTEVAKVIKLLRSLVRTDKYEFVAFWDWITSYDWIAQALRIYNIPA